MPQRVDPSSYQPPEGERPAVSASVNLQRRAHDPYAAFRFRDFSLFTAGNLLSMTGRLMLAVAVEWEVYARTHSATALGLVGLVIAVPVVTVSLPAGHLADRFSRKRIILVSQIFSVLTSLALALVSWRRCAHFASLSWFSGSTAALRDETAASRVRGKASWPDFDLYFEEK